MSGLEWIHEPGFYPELEGDRYFDDPTPTPSLNQTMIKEINAKSPRHAAMIHPRLNPYGRRRDSSKAQWLGSAIHRVALGKGKEVSIIRYPDFKSSSAQNARDLAVANGRVPVLERTYSEVMAMAEVLRERIDEALEGHPYETEVPMFWRRQTAAGPIWCRGMLDVWCEPLAKGVDVKSTGKNATEDDVSREIGSNGYDVQDKFYLEGIEAIRPDLAGRASFEFLFVETSEPFGARLFELDELSREIGGFQVDRAAEIFGRCLHGRTWPSYPREKARVSTPSYHLKKWTDIYQTEELIRHG